MRIIHQYKNGNYNVVLLEDGTKVRFNDEKTFEPSFAESIDCTITEACDGGCPYCYLGCTPDGRHADLNQPFFDTLHKGQELALNGNDLSHPQLIEFLERMKAQGVVCNITVNQKHFIREIDKIRKLSEDNLVYGIGVSLTDSYEPLLYKYITEFPNAVLHVIDGLFTKEDIENLKNKGIKILILGYKKLGRGDSYYIQHKSEIEENIQYLQRNLATIKKYFEVISFDNLAIEHLGIRNHIIDRVWKTLYMGDEGHFTFYINAVDKTYSISSLSSNIKFDIGEKTAEEMFTDIRKIVTKERS